CSYAQSSYPSPPWLQHVQSLSPTLVAPWSPFHQPTSSVQSAGS
ncbi:uncharacterized, partial [Tachysurus ichikawai]